VVVADDSDVEVVFAHPEHLLDCMCLIETGIVAVLMTDVNAVLLGTQADFQKRTVTGRHDLVRPAKPPQHIQPGNLPTMCRDFPTPHKSASAQGCSGNIRKAATAPLVSSGPTALQNGA